MNRRLVFASVLLVACWLAAQPSAAVPQDPPQQPTFRARIDSVLVDVTVLDKQGRPVLDLAANEFEIRENKQLQKIDSFRLIQIDDVDPGGPAREILSSRDQERELGREGTRLLVIFLDDYHTQRINAMRVREQLAAFVSQLTPNDMVAVMLPLTPAASLTFSYNHDATARIIAAFDGRKYDYTVRNAIEARYQMMAPELIEQMRNSMVVSALESAASYLGALRPGRKMILYVGEGLAVTVPPNLRMGGGLTAIGASPQQMAMDLQHSLNRVYQAASRGNVSVTTMDPRGLSGSEGVPADFRTADIERQIVRESTDQLRVLSAQTDGRAIVGSNDPFPGLRQMIRDLSAYYLLGYRTSAPHDGKFHEIQVRVTRRDVDVHARKGYWAFTEDEIAKAEAPPRPGPARDVTEALASLASESELATRRVVRTWIGASGGGAAGARVTLAWETTAATPAADELDRVSHVTVAATSVHGDVLFQGRVAPAAAAGRPGGSVTFDAPAGSLRVRVVAENARGHRLDAIDESFEVPDFTTSKPVVTAPVIYRARTARDMQQLRAAAAPTPAITREFSRTERLLLRFQVLGGGTAPAAVTMALLNQQGTTMAALPSPIAKPDQGYEAELPLGSLPAGNYLVEISADFGAEKVRTLVAIRVTG